MKDKKKKLNLNELTVQSFVTSLSSNRSETIKGGGDTYPDNINCPYPFTEMPRACAEATTYCHPDSYNHHCPTEKAACGRTNGHTGCETTVGNECE